MSWGCSPSNASLRFGERKSWRYRVRASSCAHREACAEMDRLRSNEGHESEIPIPRTCELGHMGGGRKDGRLRRAGARAADAPVPGGVLGAAGGRDRRRRRVPGGGGGGVAQRAAAV